MMASKISTSIQIDTVNFASRLIAWQKMHGRSGLPWQGIRDPYLIWVSEIMLQQTQVTTVIERYGQFLRRFPSLEKLAAASLDEVLAEWSGLGYYTRARNMHRCAILLLNEYGGLFPEDPKVLESLPGIGRSTAGAIAAFAYAKKTPILDANVKRVLSRVYGVQGDLQSKKKLDELWDLAKKVLPKNARSMPIYTQAFMDFGATWCTTRQPVCLMAKKTCPFISSCFAFKNQQVHDLPQKKQKKASPEFYADMAMIFYENSVLLVKRPPDSIWGGLWCLPESPWIPYETTAEATAKAAVKVSKMKRRVISKMLRNIFSAEELDSLTSAAQEFQMGISLRHIFSHRRLHIQTWRIDLKELPKLNDRKLIWAPLAQLDSFGLPQPIKLLLREIAT